MYLSDWQIRWRERLLLCCAAVFILLNQLGLMLVQERAWRDLWLVAGWVGCAVVLHVVLDRRLPHRDPYLLPTMLCLVGWGLTLIDRLLAPFADRQAVWLMVSSAVLIGLVFLPHDLQWLRRFRYTWLMAGLFLLLITVLVGVNPSGRQFNPPRLWLRFWEVYYQPSELMKIILVVFLASYLADHWISLRYNLIFSGRFHLPALGFIVPIGLMWSLCVLVVMWQRDLGTAAIFFLVFLLMLYLASGKPQLVLVGFGLLIGASLIGYYLFDVVALRIDIWLHPWVESDGRAFQIVQSLMAFSAGGIVGQGIGQGAPTFIPVVHSDFVFAAIAEEYGVVGVLGVLSLLLFMVVRGLRIALLNQYRPFAALLAAGLSLMLGIQTLMIAGGTLRLIPLTGITLPFVSYGGSALLTGFVAVGLLLILSNQSPTRTRP